MTAKANSNNIGSKPKMYTGFIILAKIPGSPNLGIYSRAGTSINSKAAILDIQNLESDKNSCLAASNHIFKTKYAAEGIITKQTGTKQKASINSVFLASTAQIFPVRVFTESGKDDHFDVSEFDTQWKISSMAWDQACGCGQDDVLQIEQDPNGYIDVNEISPPKEEMTSVPTSFLVDVKRVYTWLQNDSLDLVLFTHKQLRDLLTLSNLVYEAESVEDFKAVRKMAKKICKKQEKRKGKFVNLTDTLEELTGSLEDSEDSGFKLPS